MLIAKRMDATAWMKDVRGVLINDAVNNARMHIPEHRMTYEKQFSNGCFNEKQTNISE